MRALGSPATGPCGRVVGRISGFVSVRVCAPFIAASSRPAGIPHTPPATNNTPPATNNTPPATNNCHFERVCASRRVEKSAVAFLKPSEETAALTPLNAHLHQGVSAPENGRVRASARTSNPPPHQGASAPEETLNTPNLDPETGETTHPHQPLSSCTSLLAQRVEQSALTLPNFHLADNSPRTAPKSFEKPTLRSRSDLGEWLGDLPLVSTRDESFPTEAGTSHHRRLCVKVDRGTLARLRRPILVRSRPVWI
jgi:hypothetical protein